MKQTQFQMLALIVIAPLLLACVALADMGNLAPDGTSVTFLADDETEYYWKALVVPGSEYEVILSNNHLEYFQPAIYVMDDSQTPIEGSDIVSQLSGGAWDPAPFVLSFTGPSDGDVTIVVSVIPGSGTDKDFEYSVLLRAK